MIRYKIYQNQQKKGLNAGTIALPSFVEKEIQL